MRNNLVRFLTTALLAGSLAIFAGAQEPDNTKVNVNKDNRPTADQAKNNPSDRDTMQPEKANRGRRWQGAPKQ